MVVGYMTQKKGLVTGAVSSMKMDEKLNTLPTTSAGNILVGKLAGVSVSTRMVFQEQLLAFLFVQALPGMIRT